MTPLELVAQGGVGHRRLTQEQPDACTGSTQQTRQSLHQPPSCEISTSVGTSSEAVIATICAALLHCNSPPCEAFMLDDLPTLSIYLAMARLMLGVQAALTCHIGDELFDRKEEAEAKLEHSPHRNNADVNEEYGRPVANLEAPAGSHASGNSALAQHCVSWMQLIWHSAMREFRSWMRCSLEGLQCSTPAVCLSAEGYGVHEAGEDERHPRLCSVNSLLGGL